MGMKSEEEAVALQAIEFWTSVAEEETNLESDYLDAQEVRNGVSFVPGLVQLNQLCRASSTEMSKLPSTLPRSRFRKSFPYSFSSLPAKTRMLKRVNGTFPWPLAHVFLSLPKQCMTRSYLP